MAKPLRLLCETILKTSIMIPYFGGLEFGRIGWGSDSDAVEPTSLLSRARGVVDVARTTLPLWMSLP